MYYYLLIGSMWTTYGLATGADKKAIKEAESFGIKVNKWTVMLIFLWSLFLWPVDMAISFLGD